MFSKSVCQPVAHQASQTCSQQQPQPLPTSLMLGLHLKRGNQNKSCQNYLPLKWFHQNIFHFFCWYSLLFSSFSFSPSPASSVCVCVCFIFYSVHNLRDFQLFQIDSFFFYLFLASPSLSLSHSSNAALH